MFHVRSLLNEHWRWARVAAVWHLWALLTAATATADIFRWDNGQLIPGTEGSILGPGVQLDHQLLEFAELSNGDLTNANLADANLSYARIRFSTLTNANLGGALVGGTTFHAVTGGGFTATQLYSTRSYQDGNLEGIELTRNDLTDWDFHEQTLTNASFYQSELTNANFAGANLSGASFYIANLINADLSRATVTGTSFKLTVSRGFTMAQLYSTQSYRDKDLRGIDLSFNNLSNWDFHEQDLINSSFGHSNLAIANFSGALIKGANFESATVRGFTMAQLYSTQSYRDKDLTGVELSFNNLTGADFDEQNLAEVDFLGSTLTDANFQGANLTDANFSDCVLTNVNWRGADLRGARSLDLSGASSRNAILPGGSIIGLDLGLGDKLLVRNEDGVSDPVPLPWLVPREPIPVKIQDHVNMSDGASLELLLDADPWRSVISFQPGIPVQLGGTLELVLNPDVIPSSQIGRTWHLFDWTGVSPTGQFRADSPYTWDLSALYTKGDVTLLAVPEPQSILLVAWGPLLMRFAVRRFLARAH